MPSVLAGDVGLKGFCNHRRWPGLRRFQFCMLDFVVSQTAFADMVWLANKDAAGAEPEVL
jgi:hypothetical protein